MWEDFEVNAENIPSWKLGFHIAQIVFAFVLWCLEIAVFKDKDASINGNNGWTFACFFITIPAWIYLGMAPRFPRTRKLAEPHAMLTVDAFFVVIWLSAFAAQASYNTANSCGQACGVSKAIVGLGFFVFLFFCVTTFFSIWTLKYYQWNNKLPGYDKAQSRTHDVDPDKAAFSMAPHDEEAYAPVNLSDHDADVHNHPGGGLGLGAGSGYSADPYGAPSSVSDPYGAPSSVVSDPYGPGLGRQASGGSQVGGGYRSPPENPFRQDNPFDDSAEYHSGGVGGGPAGRYAPPSAHDDYEEDQATRPVAFPNADYDRITR
ncbi:hypothetical protein B0H63DRAFT_241694 [Podospora didyma]|uniref:MARVEL domain-containing protein n=1 Tax=Podospora didyma TaxID=330526 RepID=A0AAE0NC29_9PEZI|nr:hypothetical protein B0H63DRAFT_241694 [Podospora didyma]